MEHLTYLYNDESYRSYFMGDPPFSLAMISRKKLRIAEGFSHIEGSNARFRLNYFQDIHSLYYEKRDIVLPSGITGVFKSNWCWKHLSIRFSCVVFCLDWDELGVTTIDEYWLSEICHQLKEYMRRFRSKVIVTLVTQKEMSESVNSVVQTEKLHYDLKALLGSDFKNVLPLFEGGSEKTSAEKMYGVALEMAARYHKEEVTRLRNYKADHIYHSVRQKFKAGWHSLVLRDTKASIRFFEDAYRLLKETALCWPTVELRLCGTILLLHVLRIAGVISVISFGGSYYQLCEDHIMWLGQAFRSCPGKNKLAARFLCLLLVGDCYEWLFENTTDMNARVRMDTLSASVGAYMEALNMYEASTSSEELRFAPIFVGSECCLETHGHFFPSKNRLGILSKRVEKFLGKGGLSLKLSAEASFNFARANFWLNNGNEALKLLDGLQKVSIESFKLVEGVYGLLMENTKLNGESFTEGCSEEILFSLVSLCFGPVDGESQKQRLRLLMDSGKLDALGNVRLSYPRRGHYAPFTILCCFENHYSETPMTIRLHLSLFTASVETIVVYSLHATISWSSGGEKEHSKTYCVSGENVELCVDRACNISALLHMDEPGFYRCVSILGRLRCSGICLDVEWRLYNLSTGEQNTKMMRASQTNFHVSKHVPWIYVVKLPCRLDVEIPSSIRGVEGEDVLVHILMKAEREMAGTCRIAFPYMPGMYEFVGDVLEGSQSKDGEGFQRGFRIAVWDDLFVLSHDRPLQLSVHCRCIRAGRYVAPLLFHYKSTNYSNVEILRRVEINVLSPFSLVQTILKVAPRVVTPPTMDRSLDSEVALTIPGTSSAFMQRDRCIAIVSQNRINTTLLALQNKGDIMAHTAQRELWGENVEFVVTKGDDIVLVMSLDCQALRGLTVVSLDLVPTGGTTLLFLEGGTFPCCVEYLEALTLTAKLRVLGDGRVSFGFVRMLLSLGSGAQTVVCNIPLPEVKVEEASISLSLRGPSTAILGLPFPVFFDVANRTKFPQSCQLEVKKNGSYILLGGRTEWSFCVGPHSLQTTEVILHPLSVGTVRLPSVLVKTLPSGGLDSLYSCQIDSQHVCILPS